MIDTGGKFKPDGAGTHPAVVPLSGCAPIPAPIAPRPLHQDGRRLRHHFSL